MDLNTIKNINPEVFQCFNNEFKRCDFDLKRKVENAVKFKSQVYHFSKIFDQACILNNNYQNTFNNTGFIAALGLTEDLKIVEDIGAFDSIKSFVKKTKGEWLFGFLGYDLKNDVEDLASGNPDSIQFPAAHFFTPEILIYMDGQDLYIKSKYRSSEKILEQILSLELKELDYSNLNESDFESYPEKDRYIEAVNKLKEEIHLGNIYEVNYCRELLTQKKINPFQTGIQLSLASPAPFSAFYKFGGKYLICASPERFLLKSDKTLLSQPIKGTKRRSLDAKVDDLLKVELASDKKEKAENVMIVDLVRNDLSYTAKMGSVKVAELFGVYTFPHVHQMISTIHSELKEEIHFMEAIKHCFPMGSMTGAPKLRAMKLIEKHEKFKRGLFSGSVGMISPDQNFDFNVVIRSILYDDETNNLSIRTGSAITDLCEAETEWDECKLKAEALIKAICVV